MLAKYPAAVQPPKWLDQVRDCLRVKHDSNSYRAGLCGVVLRTDEVEALLARLSGTASLMPRPIIYGRGTRSCLAVGHLTYASKSTSGSSSKPTLLGRRSRPTMD